MLKKNKSLFYFPPIKYKENKEIINNKSSTKKFHFYLRVEKPLKLVEPTNNYFDNSLLLTKLQKRK